MEVAPYEGLQVVNDSAPEAIGINDRQHQKIYPAASSGEVLPPNNRICGLSRAIFWLAVAMTALALVVIGLGVGLGVALSKTQNANDYNGGKLTYTSR